MNTKKYIFEQQYEPETENYFDTDCYSGTACGGYEYNLFIIHESYHNNYGLNYDTYKELIESIETLFNDFEYIENHNDYTYKQAMTENGIEYNATKCSKLKKLYIDYAGNIDINCAALYLTITTGKHWETAYYTGYCQGDFVNVLYCTSIYNEENVKQTAYIYLGMTREFSLTDIDENGEKDDLTTCYGYFVPDCINENDIKNYLCTMEGLNPDEVIVKLITNTTVSTTYTHQYEEV